MPQTKRRASLQPRFLIDSSMNGAMSPMKIKSKGDMKRIPVDMQLFRIMGNTVTGGSSEYPLLFPEFVSRFIAATGENGVTVEAKLKSYKFLSETGKQKPNVESVDLISQTIVNDSLLAKPSSDTGSIPRYLPAPNSENRGSQNVSSFAQVKIKSPLQRNGISKENIMNSILLPKSLAVGGKSISRPDTPGMSVNQLERVESGNKLSIAKRSAALTSASIPSAKGKPTVYSELLNAGALTLPLSAPLPVHNSAGPKASVEYLRQASNISNGSEVPQGIANSIVKGSSAKLPSNNPNKASRSSVSTISAIAFKGNRQNSTTSSSPTKSSTSSGTSNKTFPSINQATTGQSNTQPGRYIDPLQGIHNALHSSPNDLFRKRIAELSIFQDQTVRFEQRRANRNFIQRTGGSQNHSLRASYSEPVFPESLAIKNSLRNGSPIERKSKQTVKVDQSSDEEDEDDSDSS